MAPADTVLRAATTADDAFVVEMARHACVIEDRPLPDADDDEVLEILPPAGVVPIIAQNRHAEPLGAVWTYYGITPLRRDATGTPLPELCIAVGPWVPTRLAVGAGAMCRPARCPDLCQPESVTRVSPPSGKSPPAITRAG